MFVDRSQQYLYVASPYKISKVKLENCSKHSNCSLCLSAKNPYCGWCSLENKCSLRSACAEAAQDPLYWLSHRSGKCTTVTQVHPSQIQRTTARTVSGKTWNRKEKEWKSIYLFYHYPSCFYLQNWGYLMNFVRNIVSRISYFSFPAVKAKKYH